MGIQSGVTFILVFRVKKKFLERGLRQSGTRRESDLEKLYLDI